MPAHSSQLSKLLKADFYGGQKEGLIPRSKSRSVVDVHAHYPVKVKGRAGVTIILRSHRVNLILVA